MSKTKSSFFCQQCGYESAKWIGKCPSCNTWNSFVEELIVKESDKKENNNCTIPANAASKQLHFRMWK
jgi:DNA repair protein RadA/Sms